MKSCCSIELLKIANTLAVAASIVLALDVQVEGREKKVLTIALDGLRPDALIAANAPNLDSLVDGTFFGTTGPSGIFADYAQSEHLTYSGPGWGAYMTGFHVDRHGADTNEFENVQPGVSDWFTPLEAYDSSLNTHRVLTWTIAHTSIPSGADQAEVFEYSSNGDQLMTNRVVNIMNESSTDAVMMFYSDTDVAGHAYGFDPTVPQYLDAISHADAQIGQVLNAMKARPTFANEDWLVIVTSDHGGLGTGHSGGLPPQRTIPFIVAGPLATTVLPQAHPRQVDVAATVLSYFGAPVPSNYDGHAVGLSPAGPLPATLGQNLVFNGDAEYNRGFESNGAQQYAAGWDDPGPGGITLIRYGAPDGFPDSMSPGPVKRGSNFFSGGLNASSAMSQKIDVSNLASRIDEGNLEFLLSAWLGGYSNQSDTAEVSVQFLDSGGAELGMGNIGPVSAADRGSVTSLLYRESLATVPALTRSVVVSLTATRVVGENDGYADNISLQLLLEGDLDFDGLVNVVDWIAFRGGQFANMAGLTRSQSLSLGDLNGDFHNDHADFVLFKQAFEAANGLDSFTAMLAVPEPTSARLLLCVAIPLWARSRKRVGSM